MVSITSAVGARAASMPAQASSSSMVGHDLGAPVGGGDVVLGVVKMLMTSHDLDGPCVGIGAASIDLEGAASEGAASMPAPPGVAVGIGGADAADDSSGVGGSSQEEVVDNGPCGVGGIGAAGSPAGSDLGSAAWKS